MHIDNIYEQFLNTKGFSSLFKSAAWNVFEVLQVCNAILDHASKVTNTVNKVMKVISFHLRINQWLNMVQNDLDWLLNLVVDVHVRFNHGWVFFLQLIVFMELCYILKHKQYTLLILKHNFLLLDEDDFIWRSFKVSIFRNYLVECLGELGEAAWNEV
jgi:hypothetical protein